MELKDTTELMNSADYKDRFKAEYYQTKIRYNKLHKLIIKMCKKQLGEEETNKIIDETIEEFKKENEL